MGGTFRADDIPVLYIYNKVDEDGGSHADAWCMTLGATEVVSVSARTGEGRDRLLSAMAEVYRRTDEVEDLTGNLAGEGDTVVLVMPQDIQAPKGRLILPQVQTLRNFVGQTLYGFVLYGRPFVGHVVRLVVAPVPDYHGLASISYGGALCPPQTRLTSFSVLFAARRGTSGQFLQGAEALCALASRCPRADSGGLYHVPQHEDIGRVKLPRLLRCKFGEALHIDIVSGNDFPEDLSAYDLVIHCGACMFTRRHVLNA